VAGVMVHVFSTCVGLYSDEAKQIVLGLGGTGLRGRNSIADFLRQVVKWDWQGLGGAN